MEDIIMKKLALLIIILLITGCGTSSIKLDINSMKVQSLYEMATPLNDANILKYLYEKPETFENQYILSVSIKNYLDEQNNFVESISKDIVEQYIHKVFGNNISFHHEKVYILEDNYCGFDYNKDLNQYEYLSGCDGNMNEKFYRKIISANEEDDKIIILEKSLYVYNDWNSNNSHITIYNNITDKKIISSYNLDLDSEMNIDIDDYIDSASTYQFVFKKVDNRYIFLNVSLLD